MMSTSIPAPTDWKTTYPVYGNTDPALRRLIENYQSSSPALEVLETSLQASYSVKCKKFSKIDEFIKWLEQTSTYEQGIRAISVTQLSADLLRLLGAYFEMDHDLWTSRILPCDREYFAGPFNEKGAQRFSHFHLACVEFFRATDKSPPQHRRSYKVNHTTRVIRLLDVRPKEDRTRPENPRMFAIRRISGHLRRDDKMWTFLYLCDPIHGLEDAALESDIPGTALSDLTQWVTDCLHSTMSETYARNICDDGFGLVVKVLRDIKSSWKLMLTSLEGFLEDMNENYDDQEFIDAAGFLHREYLLSIDYFQRQLFYHERYVAYLIEQVTSTDSNIVPTLFRPDFVQEKDALKVVGLRLNALRQRTTAVLDMILNINSIKQTHIQSQDARNALNQNESLRRLTLVTLAFLPPSFVATIFGMNTKQTEGLQIWLFVLVALLFSIATMSGVFFKIVNISQTRNKPTQRSDARIKNDESIGSPRKMLRWVGSFRIKPTDRDIETGFVREVKKSI